MRFALLGDHPDGLDMARALGASGRHQLLLYSGPAAGLQSLQHSQMAPRSVGDLEEVLADHEIDAVIVASGPTLRPVHLRRAMQSECHVLCVHPADPSPDVAYEAAMIQADTGRVLLPLLPMTFHPGIARLAELMRGEKIILQPAENHPTSATAQLASRGTPGEGVGAEPPAPDKSLEKTGEVAGVTRRSPHPQPLSWSTARGELRSGTGNDYRAGEAPALSMAQAHAPPANGESTRQTPLAVRLIELEIWSAEEVLLESTVEGNKPGLPGWDVLRFLGGEISEVYLLSSPVELLPAEPCVLSGRFLGGILFQATLLPSQAETRFRLSLVTATGRVSLHFALGWPGPSQLIYEGEQADRPAESWDAFHPWAMMVERFEQAILQALVKKPQPGQMADESLTKTPARLGWQDELRALELDDAARRSAERARSVTLDLQEATEEASFKGTMTLFGCSMIWLSLIVLILAQWVPWLGWIILPVFGLFLTLQILRWVVPARENPQEK